MAVLDSVTILIPTRNRADFLFRALDYCEYSLQGTGAKIMLADGSGDAEWALIQRRLEARKYSIALSSLHKNWNYPFHLRLKDAISAVATPYVLLSADDDLYLWHWLDKGIDLLESDPTFGSVFGQTLTFKLQQDAYGPFGTSAEYWVHNSRNPPLCWLEGATSQERISELGRSRLGFATAAWYALHRKDLLASLFDAFEGSGISPTLFEQFFVFYQAAFARVRMLDALYLARQSIPIQTRPPLQYRGKEKELDDLVRQSADIVSRGQGIDHQEALALSKAAYGPTIELAKQASRKNLFRLAADRLPFLRVIWQKYFVGHTIAAAETDERFPAFSGVVDENNPAVKAIAGWVSTLERGGTAKAGG